MSVPVYQAERSPVFIEALFSNPTFFFSWVGVVVFSICVHELSHGLAALWEGDTTAKDAGYLTLNPLVHMGLPSLVMLCLFGFCWGACPVNPSRFRHKYGEALVAFAGPFSNLALMAMFSALMVLLMTTSLFPQAWQGFLSPLFQLGALTNAVLFLLNMIPLAPLDGQAILASLLPQTRPLYAQIGGGSFAILILLFVLPIGFSEWLWGTAKVLSSACAVWMVQAISM